MSETKKKPTRHALAAAFAILAAFLSLAGCEDTITDEIREEARLAELPDRIITVLPSSNGIIPQTGAHTVKDGTWLSINAEPNSGFTFYRWEKTSGTGTVTFDTANEKNTRVMVTGGDAEISPIIDDDSFIITVVNDGNGTTNPSSITVTKNATSTSIVAIPKTGYAFSSWSVISGTGIKILPDASTSIVTLVASSGDATIQANFLDLLAPSGTISIQNKQTILGKQYNKSKTVTVNLTYIDNTSVAQMKLSENSFGTGTTTGWISAALSTTYTFLSDGDKTLYVRFKDDMGNESGLYTDTTYLDSTPPLPSLNQIGLKTPSTVFPEYVSSTNSNLQLSYLASDAGCGIQNVYFSNTTTRPAVAQIQSYETIPPAYTWDLGGTDHKDYTVYFWFEDKLGNINAIPYIDTVRYDDAYEGYHGNNTLDATSGATILIYPENMENQYSSVSYGSSPKGVSYLVDPDYYKWGFNKLNESSTYPVEIVLNVNNGATSYTQMPLVTFYDNDGEALSYTYTYPYLNNAQIKFNLEMPYYDTGGYEYYFYMGIQDTKQTPPYATHPNYTIQWTFSEQEGM